MFVCGTHRAFIYERGGIVPVGELTPLSAVRWQRIRDDVSAAEVTVPTTECCDLLGDLRTVLHELHIERNGVPVWEGPITRLEYQHDVVQVFAHDILWPTTRCVIAEGYDQSYPNIGNVIDRMEWLLLHCYSRDGDPWNMIATHLHPVHHADPADDPRTSRIVNAWQMYVWEDLDKYGEDYGADYTVVNRDIYWSDISLAWNVIPDLDESHLSQFPRIVEYGNQLATRGVVTNGHGYAGVSPVDPVDGATYGTIDLLTTNESDGDPSHVPRPEELAQWTDTATRSINGRAPAPVAIVIPANTTLLPGAPWDIDDLFPGSWFIVTSTRLCRTVSEYQRLNEVVVTESAPQGEQVQFTAVSAPATAEFPA
jgi:hypothetical protein